MIKDKKIIYGIGVFVALIVFFSMKNVKLEEITTESDNSEFDSKSLPTDLRPPLRVDDISQMENLANPRKFSLIGGKSR